ncbi:YbaB/EbfC family nucleoid-associated protein [Prescottella defluvii]|uniref:YbaB/EbfC family nucleoid-associated protein n=1 Tax=Prescottella defluvii TaxID=1323361 RepID=UPI0004F268D4|nr:YbaB/EbfC family nucleoid-associated protein [Prescottella defluvii]
MSGHDMDAIVARASAQLNLFDDALSGLRSIRAHAVSDDGVVRVEVDGNGSPTGMWLSDSLLGLDARALARTITHTAHRAAAAAAEERNRITAALFTDFTNS